MALDLKMFWRNKKCVYIKKSNLYWKLISDTPGTKWARSIVLEIETGCLKLFDIDTCQKYSALIDDVKEMPAKGFKLPATGQ